jgi:hypothetical protein
LAQSPQARPTSTKRVEFDDANVTGHWAIEAHLVGGVELRGESMFVAVDRCTLFRPERFPARYDVVSVRAGITRYIDGPGWAMQRTSAQHEIGHSFDPGEKLELKPFEFQIPIGDFEIQRGDWITFEFAGWTGGRQSGGLVYAHAHIDLPPTSFRFKMAGSAVPFEVASEAVWYPIVAEIAGSIAREPDSFRIVIRSCVLRLSERFPPHSREVVSIAASVMRPNSEGVTQLERRGPARPVGQVLRPRDKIELPPFELRIELTGFTTRDGDRLGFPIRYRSPAGVVQTAYAYAPLGLP